MTAPLVIARSCPGCEIMISSDCFACFSCMERLPRDLSIAISDTYGAHMLAMRDAGIWWREHPS